MFLQEVESNEQKNKQINTLKQLIFEVIMQKINKNESQSDAEYYLQQLEEFKQ